MESLAEGGLVMVYGLSVKPVNGYYVEVEALDGDIRKIEVADATPDGGLPFLPHIQPPCSMGRPVKPDHVPTRMRWGDRHGKPVPDFDNGLILNVSQRAKDFIESFEPGVHQFLPVEYVDRQGAFLESRYFLIVCNRLDTVDRRHSRLNLVRGVMWSPDGVPNPKLVFNRAQCAGAHLWKDKHLAQGEFISAEFADAYKRSGLTGLRLSDEGAETV